jgi:hypothetical protein
VLEPDAREYARALEGESRALEAAHPIGRLVDALDALSGPAASVLAPAPAVAFVREATRTHGPAAAGAYAKRLVCALVEDHAARVQRVALPESIRALYPATLGRIVRGLRAAAHEAYVAGPGDFWRDLRLAAQLTVPLTASRVLDRVSFLPRTFYRYQGPVENLRCVRFLVFRLHGLGPVFRVHIDERDMSEFDDAGCDRAYLRVAEMLRLYPAVKGAAGTSWTHDPQLDGLSPKLVYPRQLQLSHGAFMRHEGASEVITERALRKSGTRRRAYERGEYVPQAYTVVWARRDLLRWAEDRAGSGRRPAATAPARSAWPGS